jgi:phage tail-like protein
VSELVKYAAVGCGGMGRRHLRGMARLYQSSMCNMELVACCDLNQENANFYADEAKELLGTRPRVFSDVAEMKRAMPNGKVDVIKVPATRKWSNIELKRGIDQDKTLWNWHKIVLDGKIKEARKDCQITLLDYEGKPIMTYSLVNAWPVKYSGMGLKADSNEVAVEGLTLAHEGFEMT